MPNYLIKTLNQFLLYASRTTLFCFLPINSSVQAQPIVADAKLPSETTLIKYREASNTVNLIPYFHRKSLVPSLQTSNRIFNTILQINIVNQITQTCSAQVKNNSFTIIGRGGIASSSREILNTTSSWIDWRVGESKRIAEKLDNTIQEPLVEATNWQVDANGIQLLASSSQIPLSDYTTRATHGKTMPCRAQRR